MDKPINNREKSNFADEQIKIPAPPLPPPPPPPRADELEPEKQKCLAAGEPRKRGRAAAAELDQVNKRQRSGVAGEKIKIPATTRGRGEETRPPPPLPPPGAEELGPEQDKRAAAREARKREQATAAEMHQQIKKQEKSGGVDQENKIPAGMCGRAEAPPSHPLPPPSPRNDELEAKQQKLRAVREPRKRDRAAPPPPLPRTDALGGQAKKLREAGQEGKSRARGGEKETLGDFGGSILPAAAASSSHKVRATSSLKAGGNGMDFTLLQRGMGALLAQLRASGDLPGEAEDTSSDDGVTTGALKKQAAHAKSPALPEGRPTGEERTVTSRRGTTIRALPVSILEDILEMLGQDDISRALASGFLFVRAAMAPCPCVAFRRDGPFLGALMQPSRQGSFLSPPKQMHPRHIGPACAVLERFFGIANRAQRYMQSADCRGGRVLMLGDLIGRRLQVCSPFHTKWIVNFPPAPVIEGEQFLCAAPVPQEAEEFCVLLFSRRPALPDYQSLLTLNKYSSSFSRRPALPDYQTLLTVKKYSSSLEAWEVINLIAPFQISPKKMLRAFPVYCKNKVHILDPGMRRIIAFNTVSNQLDIIFLPSQVKMDTLTSRGHILARTRHGELCWAVVDHRSVTIYCYTGDSWNLRWRWSIPERFYCCHLVGKAEANGLLLLGCYGDLCSLDIEQGRRVDLKDAGDSYEYLCFEMEHPFAEHL